MKQAELHKVMRIVEKLWDFFHTERITGADGTTATLVLTIFSCVLMGMQNADIQTLVGRFIEDATIDSIREEALKANIIRTQERA